MALMKCPDCGREMSTDAYKCPQCAKILRKPTRTVFGKLVKLSFILFNIAMLIWVIALGSVGSEMIDAAATSAAEGEAVLASGLTLTFFVGLWVAGSFILGIITLLTRPKAH